MWAARRHPLLWLRVRWSHWSLDARLAAGIDPASDPALIMRAGELRSPRHRRRLARSIERVAGESDVTRRPAFTAAVPLVREQVADARESLLFLAHLLRRAERVRPVGIAMVRRLLTDGGSVLYVNTANGTVELQVQAAIDRLVGEPDVTPEAWFSISNPRFSDETPGLVAPKPPRGARPRRPRKDVRA
jgi:glycine/D-amino acid oxidase-like deaminating enzyme